MVLRPVEFHLQNGEMIAGVAESESPGHFTMVFLHDRGADLDALLPIMGLVGVPEARKIAVDLPGCGLSSGSFDPARIEQALHDLRDVLRQRDWGPFLFVAAGSLAATGLSLAVDPDTLGLCLVSPVLGGEPPGLVMPRCPVLAFIASNDPVAAAEWLAIRSFLRSWWLGVSIAADHAALVTADASVSGQIASHLQGFARDLYTASPLVAGRIA